MVYFMEGVYSAYLAWFLVYKSGCCLKLTFLILVQVQGYDLWPIFLIKSASDLRRCLKVIFLLFFEQQSLLQHHGLEFWNQYIEPQTLTAVNTYCRFKTRFIYYGSSSHEGERASKIF